MAERIDPESLEIITSDLIKVGMAAWFDRTKTTFCYQAFDSEGTIPPGRAHGAYVNPNSFQEFLDRLSRDEFDY